MGGTINGPIAKERSLTGSLIKLKKNTITGELMVHKIAKRYINCNKNNINFTPALSTMCGMWSSLPSQRS